MNALVMTFSVFLIWPFHASRVTSEFGYRKADHQRHNGIDLPAKIGTPVRACGPGKVILAKSTKYSGLLLIVDHGDGLITSYAHLSRILVKQGSNVKQGQVVGRVGTTGKSTGPHLHLEVWANGKPYNPREFIANRLEPYEDTYGR